MHWMVHIEIRNVPEDLHQTLKARAAEEGLSLSAYMRSWLIDRASNPTVEELSKPVGQGKDRDQPLTDRP